MIEHAQFRQVLTRVFPNRELRSIELLEGGLTNRNYLARFDGTGDCAVLRIYSHGPEVCEKELGILRAASYVVPVPEVIHADPKGEDGAGPYIVYRFAEGITFLELKAKGSGEDMASAAYAIGMALAPVRMIAPNGFPGSTAGYRLPNEWIDSNLLEQRLGAWEINRLRAFVDAWWPWIQPLYADRALVHGDFNNRNTIVKHDGGRWTVTAILDWERASLASPLWDAARFICYESPHRPLREPHFANGFRDGGGTLPEDWTHFARTINAISAAESLTRSDLPPAFIPELRELVVAAMDKS
jgi:fructokinase